MSKISEYNEDVSVIFRENKINPISFSFYNKKLKKL